jgi:hypothetical protein
MIEKYKDLIMAVYTAVESGEIEPGTPAKIAETSRGTYDQQYREARRIQDLLIKYFTRGWPYEKWTVRFKRPTDPWGGFEIVVEYYGEAPRVQERGKWKAQRRRQRYPQTGTT